MKLKDCIILRDIKDYTCGSCCSKLRQQLQIKSNICHRNADEVIKTVSSRNILLKSAIYFESVLDFKKPYSRNYAWILPDMVKAINLRDIEMVDYIIEKTGPRQCYITQCIDACAHDI